MIKPSITVASWDEAVSSAAIQRGTGLTFSIPPHLVHRDVYLYIEANVANGFDFFLKGEIALTFDGQPVSVLPASLAVNASNTLLTKSVPCCFTFQELTRQAANGVPILGNAGERALRVCLSNGFQSTPANLVTLYPTPVVAHADRFTYVVQDWSLSPSPVTGFRAFGFVLSSSHPL